MKRVITYGTFDVFHYGHYNLLKRCKFLNGEENELYVGVSTEEMCASKGKTPLLSTEIRKEMVGALRFVDHVFDENSMCQKTDDIKKYHIDYFVLGDDYKEIFPKMKEYEIIKELGCQVVFLPRTPIISSTILKEKIREQKEGR